MRILAVTLLFVASLMGGVLQEVIDGASPGDIIELPEGVYRGNIVINKPLVIDGKNKKAVILGDSNDTVIRVKSPYVVLKNLTIKASGTRDDVMDAAVLIADVSHCEVNNCTIEDSLYGISLQMAHHCKIIGNTISSKDELEMGIKGDAIRLWYSNDNIIRKNRVARSRDMVVWYSHSNVIEDNHGEGCRYSLHFMYAGANTVRNNTFVHNLVGIFFMYSRDTVATGNVVRNAQGVTGIGIGLKECSGFKIKDNTVIYNAMGFYIDRSPFEPDSKNIIENNRVLYNSEGIHFHSISEDNVIKGNTFSGNIENIVNDTRGIRIEKNEWLGNYWDDYEGFDKNKDGIGDTPYRLYYYADKLWLYNPDVKFFYGSPVIGILNFLAKLAPFSEPVFLLADKEPRMYMGGGDDGKQKKR